MSAGNGRRNAFARRMVMTNPYEDMPCDLGNRKSQQAPPTDFVDDGVQSAAALPPLDNVDGFNSPSQVG